MSLIRWREVFKFKSFFSRRSRGSTTQRGGGWRPSLESLEDRLVPAPVIQVFLANGPSPTGPSPGYVGTPPATSPGFAVNATTSLRQNPPVAIGSPLQTPSAFVPGPSQSRVTSSELVASGFPSWMARANPGTAFGAPFAQELGNFEFFAVHIVETTPGQNSFRLADLGETVTASNPTASAFFAPASHPLGNWAGDLNTTDKIGFLADGTQVSGPGSANTLIHELFFVGLAIGDAADTFPGSNQQKLDAAVAELQALQDAPGTGFMVTTTYNLIGTSAAASGAATLRVDTPLADLGVVKAAAPSPVLAGQNLTYTETVTNSGPAAATGVTLTDTLPGGATLVSATSSQGTVMNAGGTITADLGNLANGGTATVTVVVQVPTTPGTISNTATVTATQTDPNPNNNTSTVTTTISPAVDLVVTKASSPSPALAGQNFTYTVTIGNNGPQSATGVTLNDVLPAGASFISATSSQGTVGATGNAVTANLGTLASGGSATVTIVARAPLTPGQLTNSATAAANEADTNPANNTGTVITTVSAAVDLVVAKTDVPDPVLTGQRLTYTITVGNAGPDTATGVTLADRLPAGLTFVFVTPSQGTAMFANGAVTADLGTLANGASATVTIGVQAPSAVGSIVNVATAASDQPDTNPANNTATTTTTVNANPITPPLTTPNRRFVAQVYRDLLQREASQSEQALWGDPLDNGQLTRPQVVQAIQGSPEYRTVLTGQLYQKFLHRAPDAQGLAFFLSFFAQGGTTQQAEAILVGSPEYFALHGSTNAGFVQAVYQDVLLRAASPPEVQSWLTVLAAGASRMDVATAIITSPEGDAVAVQLAYQSFLKRPADPAGQAFYVAALRQGATLDQVNAALITSAEYFTLVNAAIDQAWVTQVYPDVLQRPVDAAGLAFWTPPLNQGVALPSQVALGIDSSPEAEAVFVRQEYLRYLGRAVDPQGLTFGIAFLTNGGTREQFDVFLTSSPEYFQKAGGTNNSFLNALYQDALGRPIDAASLAFYTQAFAQGATRADVATVVFTSQEFRTDLVQGYYQAFLRRTGEAGGVGFWVNVLAGGARDEAVIAGFLSSPEYFSRL